MSSFTQSVIPPSINAASTQVYSDAKVNDLSATTNIDDKNKTDFRTIITNSMDELQKERKAKENGDLSSSSDAEFLEKLADKSKEKRTPKNELGKDDFLKLFVTQLQHQDPMNPDKGDELAAKLAQFNSLEQMMNMNKGIDKMIAAQGSERNTQMINYIGKEVTVDGGRVQLKGGQVTSSEFNTEVPIAASTLEVRDGAGILVSQVDLGPMDSGTHPLTWDGKSHDGHPAGDGVYTYSVNARNMDVENIPINLSSKARINGVDIKSKDGALFSDFGRVTFDQIRSVGKIGYDSVETPKAAAAAAPAGANILPGTPLPGEVNLPLNPEKPKNNATPVAENLDKLQAQGKLNLKQPGPAEGKSATAQIQAKEAAKAVEQRAGAVANPVDLKKSIDPQPTPSAKLMETEKSPAATAS